MRKMVYVDTETTGLEEHHQVCEIGWAVGDEPVRTIVPPHDLAGADPAALRINGYFERGLHLRQLDGHAWINARAALIQDFDGASLVAANPAFDAAGLKRTLGLASWHYRLRDVEEKAATVFGWDDSEGMFKIAEELRRRGYAIPEPDHTAGADTETLRACWKALVKERECLSEVTTLALRLA